MMRETLRKAVAIGVLGMQVLLFRCGSLTESPAVIAGGSGAGNPGGTVTISMSVQIAQAEATKAALKGRHKMVVDSISSIHTYDSIHTHDLGGTTISMTDILLQGVFIHFIVDSTQTPSDLLAAMHNRPSNLSCDSNSIILIPEESFYALSGSSDSTLPLITLPLGRYTGIKLVFPQRGDSVQQVERDTVKNQIVMKGTFSYFSQPHTLNVQIAYSQGPCIQTYSFAGGIFTLSPTDTTNLELQFEADKWFSDINVVQGLENGDYSFDDCGALNFTNYSNNPWVEWNGATIATDFLASGSLTVY